MVGRKRNVDDVLAAMGNDKVNVLIRVDFNVPLDGSTITDDSRIRGALPTIKKVIAANKNAILCSHMGRPKLVQKGEDADGSQRKSLSLSQITTRLSELLDGKKIEFVDDCIGDKVTEAVKGLSPGSILVLENLRFYKEEEKNEEGFVKSLASIADAYINDAFGTSHRAHASVAGVPGTLPKELCGVGMLVASEVSYLDFSQKKEGEKVAAIIGGSKVSTKLPVIKGLLNSVDTLILGGGLAYTFAKAQGVKIGTSLVEDDLVDTAKELLETAKSTGKTLVLPIDAVCASEFPKGPTTLDTTKTFDVAPGSAGIEDGWMGLDVGPKTVAIMTDALKDGVTKLVFNGPMGVFEIAPFDEGTKGLVDAIIDVTKGGCVSVVGGGDSVAALEQFGKTKEVSYVSTGGGATLELLAGDVLPGVAAISEVEG